MNEETQLKIGTKVEKVGGDYTFAGVVVAAFVKLGGQLRYVVEDDRGVLHIYSGKNLKKAIGPGYCVCPWCGEFAEIINHDGQAGSVRCPVCRRLFKQYVPIGPLKASPVEAAGFFMALPKPAQPGTPVPALSHKDSLKDSHKD